jgi:hypothetical protein
VSRFRPTWPLIRQVVRIVHADPYGGAHRERLAEMLQLPARRRALSDALVIAYRNKKIDFCRQYVVKPAPVGTSGGSGRRSSHPGPVRRAAHAPAAAGCLSSVNRASASR